MVSTAYIDEKWTWRVPIASSICSLLVIGYLKGYGIIMIAYNEELNFLRLYLMAVLGINVAAVGILAPVVEKLCQRYTSRAVVFVCGLLIFIAMMISSHVTHPAALIIFMGVLTGLGFAGTYATPLCINIICFKRFQSTATGVAYAGASLGQIIMPLCFDALIDYYSVSGCVMLLAAIYSNICVLGLFLPDEVINRKDNRVVLRQGYPGKSFDRGLCCCLETNSVISKRTKHKTSTKAVPTWRGSCLFLLFIIIANFAYTNQFIMFPNFVREQGLSRSLISRLIAGQGIIDLILRVLTGIVADRLSKCYRTYIVAAALAVQGIFVIVMSQWPVFEIFIIYSVIYGVTGAIYMSQWSVILVDMIGVSLFPVLFTRCLMVMGGSNLLLTFLMGYLRDTSGSYSLGLLITGVNACVAATMLIPSVVVGEKIFSSAAYSPDEDTSLNSRLNDTSEPQSDSDD